MPSGKVCVLRAAPAPVLGARALLRPRRPRPAAELLSLLSRADRSPGAARQGSFEARGVVLRGHATDRVFFVTAVEIDAAQPLRPSRSRRSNADPAQRQLPLALIIPGGGNDG